MTPARPRRPLAVRAALRVLPPLKLFDALAESPGTFWTFLLHTGAVLGRSAIPASRRELVILRVGVLCDCAYEWSQHEAIARRAGVTDAELRAVRLGELEDPALASTDRLVLRYTDEVVLHGRPGPPTRAALHADLTLREITDLLHVIGSYMAVARLANALELAPDPPVVVRGLRGRLARQALGRRTA